MTPEQKPEIRIIIPEEKIMGLTLDQFNWVLAGMVVALVGLIVLLIYLERKHHGLAAIFKKDKTDKSDK
jgi:hypothetical protein